MEVIVGDGRAAVVQQKVAELKDEREAELQVRV
jgi:hypothetical protein